MTPGISVCDIRQTIGILLNVSTDLEHKEALGPKTTDTDRLPPISTTHPGHLGEGPERELWTTSLTSDMLALLAGATFIREVAQAGVGPQRSLGVSYSASSSTPKGYLTPP